LLIASKDFSSSKPQQQEGQSLIENNIKEDDTNIDTMHQRRRHKQGNIDSSINHPHNTNDETIIMASPSKLQQQQQQQHHPSHQEILELDYAVSTSESSGSFKSNKINNVDEGIQTIQLFTPYCVTWTNVSLYVLSGCSQPLIMTLLKEAGVADSSCQLYMLFYCVFPAGLIMPVIRNNEIPKKTTILKACGIAGWDIVSTTMNYTGAALSGPTIFAIIYSSVTIWTAVLSQIFLSRMMNLWQWITVLVVFAGLTITATDSLTLGKDVAKGSMLIIVGSAMHGVCLSNDSFHIIS
jgi:hypothetical protein